MYVLHKLWSSDGWRGEVLHPLREGRGRSAAAGGRGAAHASAGGEEDRGRLRRLCPIYGRGRHTRAHRMAAHRADGGGGGDRLHRGLDRHAEGGTIESVSGMGGSVRRVLTLSFLVPAALAAQTAPSTPQGIYAVVNVEDNIKTRANFNKLYLDLLSNPA